MYYINPTPNESGNHGNPMGQPFPNCVTLPDDLLSPYLAAKGFVTLTVENGVPLIRGLPISNLSDGELLELCVDITVSKPGQLQIILIDGAERLDKESRDKLYAKCKAKGLQLIATRVTDSDVLEVTEL